MSMIGTGIVVIQQRGTKKGEGNEEQEIFGSGTDGGNGPLLDATNPMDLINRLRQSESMNDATSPSDAIDAALKDFQQASP